MQRAVNSALLEIAAEMEAALSLWCDQDANDDGTLEQATDALASMNALVADLRVWLDTGIVEV